METYIVMVHRFWDYEKKETVVRAIATLAEDFASQTSISASDIMYFKIKADSEEEAKRLAIIDREGFEKKVASLHAELAEVYEKYNVYTGQ